MLLLTNNDFVVNLNKKYNYEYIYLEDKIQVNFDFDLTLCDPSKAYKNAIEDILNIKVDLNNISSACDIKREVLKSSAKEIIYKLNFEPLKKIIFEKEIIKTKIDEKIALEYYDKIKFDKKIEKVFSELKEKEYNINIISNNNTKILYEKNWPGKEYVDKILTPPLIKEKPSGDWIKCLKNKDPKQNFMIGDSWRDMKSGLNAKLPKENLIGFNKYNKNGGLEKYTKNIFDDLDKVKEYIFEKTKI